MAIEGSVASAAAQRLAGERVGRPRAFLTAAAAGVAVGVLVYRLLRSGDEPEPGD